MRGGGGEGWIVEGGEPHLGLQTFFVFRQIQVFLPPVVFVKRRQGWDAALSHQFSVKALFFREQMVCP